MSWRYIGAGSNIPGVPPTDLTDEEFDAYAKTYEQINQFPAGSLIASLLWEHQNDKPAKPVAAATTNEGE